MLIEVAELAVQVSDDGEEDVARVVVVVQVADLADPAAVGAAVVAAAAEILEEGP